MLLNREDSGVYKNDSNPNCTNQNRQPMALFPINQCVSTYQNIVFSFFEVRKDFSKHEIQTKDDSAKVIIG